MASENLETTKEKLTRARRIAIILATSTAISLVLLVYAHIKRTEAHHMREMSEELQRQNDSLRLELEQERKISEVERKEAIVARENAENLAEQLAQAFSEIQKNKK